MNDLHLAVNLSGWRAFISRRTHKKFLPVAQKILERDHYTCQYCGFQAKEYQEIVNLDGNYKNNILRNMITACCFCSQCLFLQSIGLDEQGGGQLIYMPEMSQSHLNSLCHVLFCAIGNNSDYQESAQSIYRSFKFRSQPIESKFGSGTSHPPTFGQLLLEYEASFKKDCRFLLQDLRLLPSYTKFKNQLDTWAASAVAELSVPQG